MSSWAEEETAVRASHGHATTRGSHSESIDAFVQPEPQHFVQRQPHLLAVPVQIGLVLPKYMQILAFPSDSSVMFQ